MQKQFDIRDDNNTNNTNSIYFVKIAFQGSGFMSSARYVDRQVTSIAALGRDELKKRIRNFRGRFKLDFTEDYLNKISVERLRHILLAALITTKTHN
jgi:hypothetical protein